MKWFVKLFDTDWVDILLRLCKFVVKLLYTLPPLALLWYMAWIFSGLILFLVNHWFIHFPWDEPTRVTSCIIVLFVVNGISLFLMVCMFVESESTCPSGLKRISLKSLLQKLKLTVGLTKGFLE